MPKKDHDSKAAASLDEAAKLAAKDAEARKKALTSQLAEERAVPAVAEHYASVKQAGEAARATLPFEQLAAWTPDADRRDPVQLLVEQDESRLPQLVPIRHYRMAVSPFTFYRGAARIMAADLASRPDTGIQVQICGDAHLLNFGAYAAPDRTLVFDLNDFDETIPAPWEYDLKRLAASFAIAAADADFSEKAQRKAATHVAQTYADAIREFSCWPPLDLYYARITVDDIIAALPEQAASIRKTADKAMRKDSQHVLRRLAELQDGEWRIKSTPPIVVPLRELLADTDAEQIDSMVAHSYSSYRDSVQRDRQRVLDRYQVVDVALKVVGVGSVGTRAFIVLMISKTTGAPLFLQVKQAQESVYQEFLRTNVFANQGERVVEGQRLMQAASDIFLGWSSGVQAVDYYWRQLKDWKGSPDVSTFKKRGLDAYAKLCGWTLARAHARSGAPVKIASYIGDGPEFAEAMAEFAVAYARQNEADYAEFKAAIERGELAVEAG